MQAGRVAAVCPATAPAVNFDAVSSGGPRVSAIFSGLCGNPHRHRLSSEIQKRGNTRAGAGCLPLANMGYPPLLVGAATKQSP
jgi:hypothetical protein